MLAKSKWPATCFHYISIAFKLAYNKKKLCKTYKLYKTLDYCSRDILSFDFLGKSLGIVSPPHFMYDFSTKFFLMLNSINSPNLFVWLPLLLEILSNMYNTIIFLIKPFFYTAKQSRQKLKYLENKKSF